ncbi:MAG TPA: carboxypeptidase-like regulatory domain-containing protein, partial [Bryobacteraceae bacterium]
MFLLLSAPIAVVYGQETVNYASVGGRVTDPSHAVVEGAYVTARETDTGLTQVVETDHDGRFRFAYLRVGPYTITVHQAGFADAQRSVTLTIGAAFALPIELALRAAGTSVTVSSEGPVLEEARTQIAGTI